MSNSTRNWLIVAIIFVAALGTVLRLDSAEEPDQPAMRKWEYYVTTDIDRVSTLGIEGWELVAVTRHESRNEGIHYLKRERR